ncbi:MAG: hypothetical protein IT436_02640 [Phycisphaerales bacterium]|nr:hypothetical protein [Phycisphaerales bacterium]
MLVIFVSVTGAAPPIPGSFQSDTVDAVRLVRDVFARIIERKCPGPKAVTNVSKAFGVHRKLAWQVIKVAYEDDPFVAALHIPTGKSIEVWLEAARLAEVPDDLIDSARRASARFEALAASHAASRDELEMLLESCAPGQDSDAAERWRERSFAGNSFVWGARCKVLLALMVQAPSEDRPGYFHTALVRGLIGFRQTRPGVRWLVNQSVVADDRARTDAPLTRVPLDPEGARAHNGAPVLPKFCSSPVPELARRFDAGGLVHDEFVSGPVGLVGERTLMTGEVLRNLAPTHATEHDRIAHFGSAVRTPAELLHFDLFVHAGLFGEVERQLRVFSDLASPVAFDEADALPVPEKIAHLGRGVSLAHSPDIPGYADLASWVFDRMGLRPGDYDLFRVRMRYPPMPVSVMVRHELREEVTQR